MIEWNKIKNEKDFSAFFNFAIATEDTVLLSQCIDSLEKYKPTNTCIILKYLDYYHEKLDTVYHSSFFLFDNCEYLRHIKDRNIVFINIDSYNSVQIEYSDSSYSDYHKLLLTLFDTTGDSYDLPEYLIANFNKEEYIARKLGTFISCEMSPDTLNEKATWRKLIKTNKQVLEVYEKIRDYKSLKIFECEFKELYDLERKFIMNLVPVFIENYFYYSFINIPPPPPPPPIKGNGSDK